MASSTQAVLDQLFSLSYRGEAKQHKLALAQRRLEDVIDQIGAAKTASEVNGTLRDFKAYLDELQVSLDVLPGTWHEQEGSADLESYFESSAESRRNLPTPAKELGLSMFASRVLRSAFMEKPYPPSLESALERAYGRTWRTTSVDLIAGRGHHRQIILGEDINAPDSHVRRALTQAAKTLVLVQTQTDKYVPKPKLITFRDAVKLSTMGSNSGNSKAMGHT